MWPNPERQAGFTLLELLLALGIFALVSAMAYTGLNAVLETGRVTARQAESLSDLQRTLLRLQRDLEQAAPRAIRDGFGDRKPAMIYQGNEEEGLEFTHAGRPNPAGYARSDLQRVAYSLREGALLRVRWPTLDRGDESPPAEVEMLSGITGLKLRFLEPEGTWIPQWPPQGTEDPPALPRAVELTLEVDGVGPVLRVFRVTG